MAAGNGVIQAELSIEFGKIAAQLNAAAALVAKFAQGTGASMKPANDAIESIGKSAEKSLQSWKSSQVTQQRTADFLGRTLVEVGGASREAAEGLSRFAGVGMEVLAGGGILGVGLAAASAITWTFNKLTEESRKAAEICRQGCGEDRPGIHGGGGETRGRGRRGEPEAPGHHRSPQDIRAMEAGRRPG